MEMEPMEQQSHLTDSTSARHCDRQEKHVIPASPAAAVSDADAKVEQQQEGQESSPDEAASSDNKAQKQQLLLQPQQQLGGPACWKSTPGSDSVNGQRQHQHQHQQPPRLSLSAILPLSAMGNNNNNNKQQQQQDRNNVSARTVHPVGSDATEPGRARRFFTNPRVRRSLAIDAATVLVFVPLAVSTSAALMRLFVDRAGLAGLAGLQWHHYLLVAALASLALIPACRLAYSCPRYRRRFRRMAAAVAFYEQRESPPKRPTDYTTKSRRIEAAAAVHANEYREFANLVARRQNIELSRRKATATATAATAATAADAEAAEASNISGLSGHRPDVSMAAYNC